MKTQKIHKPITSGEHELIFAKLKPESKVRVLNFFELKSTRYYVKVDFGYFHFFIQPTIFMVDSGFIRKPTLLHEL